MKQEIELLIPFCIIIFSKQIKSIIGAKNFEILSQKYPNNYKNLNELIEAIDSGYLSKASKTQAARVIRGFGEELKQQASKGVTNLNFKSMVEEAFVDQFISSQSPTRTPQTPKKSRPDSKGNRNPIKKPKYTSSKSRPESDGPSPDDRQNHEDIPWEIEVV